MSITMKPGLTNFKIHYRQVIPAALVFFCFIYLFSCKTNYGEVITQDIETVKSLDERTYLRKEWKVFAGDSLDFVSPDFDDSHWESMDFPKMNFFFDLEKSNFYWFRKIFYVSEELTGQALGYVAGRLPSSTEIYLNGGLVGISGFLPPDMYYPTSGFPRGYLLSDKLVNYGGKNIIALRIYNELDHGDLNPGFITNNTDRIKYIFYQYILHIYIPIFFVGVALIVIAFSLIIFLQNKKDRFHLYISLACFSMIFLSIRFFSEYIPVPYLIVFKISQTGILLAQMFFAFYFQSFYNIHSKWWIKLGLSIIFLTCSIILITSKTLTAARTINSNIFYIFLVTPVNIYLFILSIYALIKGNKYAKFLIIGSSGILLTATHDIIFLRLQIEPVLYLAHTGFIIYMVFLFITNSIRYTDTRKKAEKLNIDLIEQKDAFFRFVPGQILSLLGKQSAVSIKRGDNAQMNMSILFSDIKKFSALSETRTPEDTFNLLNNYILQMEAPINKYDGFVDKYIGDAIMALFHENQENGRTSSDRALMAAIEMRQELEEFNKEQKKGEMVSINIGIGINTGVLMLGTIGGTNRLDTTVIGDSVNLAARLENLTRYYKNSIIISEWSYRHLSDPGSFLIREIDNVIVRGKTKECRILEVFDADTEEMKELKIKTMESIQTGIQLYKERKFKQAYTNFKAAKKIFPNDFISSLYITRCYECIKNPPPHDWTAVFKIH